MPQWGHLQPGIGRTDYYLQDRGYEFVPISQLIYKDKYHLNHEGRQISEESR